MTALLTRDEFGGMAANDGPVPVRTLAQAARLMREGRQFPLYGIEASSVSLDYRRLLDRVHEVTKQARTRSLMRDDLERAVLDGAIPLPDQVSPIGSFTDPEYASVGLSEAAARETHEVATATQPFGSMPRPIIDGRETGFCKLVVDRHLHTILGCHIVGERAVELAQLAATAMAAKMPVEQLALVPFSFPTYANALGRAAIRAAIELDDEGNWAVEHLVTAQEVGIV
jgi:pyruvate/2-oxoglutarate dehydrogenase complex dihydrolipoamide dehydrogenase (E3) component